MPLSYQHAIVISERGLYELSNNKAGGDYEPDMGLSDIERGYPLSGPVHESDEPLQVTISDLHHSGGGESDIYLTGHHDREQGEVRVYEFIE